MPDYSDYLLIGEFAVGGLVKVIFLGFAIYSYFTNKQIGHYLRSKYKWSNSFFIKMTLNFWICMNYASMALYFWNIYSFFVANSFIWFVSCSLLYFEYIRRIPHKWVGLRFFWFGNGIVYIAKIIFVIVMVILHDDDTDKIAKKLLFFYLIQGLPSIFLFVLSIINYNDNKEDPTMSTIADDISQEINSNFISNYSNSIELNISEIKSNKYIRNDNNVLIPVDEDHQEFKPDKVKLRLNLKINQNKTFFIKKTLTEIIEFNYNTYAKFKSDESNQFNSTLIIQLKNITSIFSKKCPNEPKLRELEVLYISLCSKFKTFLEDFLNFCEIKDESIKSSIQGECKIYESSNDSANNDKSSRSRMSSVDTKKIKPDEGELQKSKEYVNMKIKDLIMESNDIFKMVNYITNVVLSSNYKIVFNFQDFRERTQLIKSDLIFNVYYEGNHYETEINIKSLATFLEQDKKISKSMKAIQLHRFFKDSSKVMNLKIKNSNSRMELEDLVNKMVNDLFYLNEISFSVFSLNLLMNLDNEEIDMDIINSFFELDNVAYAGTSFINSLYDNTNNIKISCESHNIVVKNEKILLQISILKISTQKEWNSEIDLMELSVNCIQIIALNKNYQRFSSLNDILSDICGFIDKIKENDDAIDKHIDKLIESLNKLFEKQNLYVFFNDYFREIFMVDQYNEKEKNKETEEKGSESFIPNSENNSILENLLS